METQTRPWKSERVFIAEQKLVKFEILDRTGLESQHSTVFINIACLAAINYLIRINATS